MLKNRLWLISLLLASSFLTFPFLACSTPYKSEYKLSVVVGPKGPWGEGASKFADLVRKKSGERINIKCYFSGQLFAGKQTNEFFLLRQGVIDFALGSTINWSTTIKELNLFSLPFFFSDYKSLDKITHGKTGKRINGILKKKGVVNLGWGENGFRELTNGKREVKKPDDLNGLKIRVVGSPIFIDTFRALGANPVSMNWGEAVTAFQQKTVDGQENPIVSVILPYKLYQMHDYITIWHYAIDPLVLGINKDIWNNFTKEDQRIVKEAAKEAMDWQRSEARKGLEKNQKAIDFLKKKGMKVTILSKDEMKIFKNLTGPVYKKWVKKIGEDLVKLAEEELK
jgi:tripartite ATP-independent transporter DctP family solute receptor